MPLKRKRRRRVPSDAQLMKNITDPGVMKSAAVIFVLVAVLFTGVYLIFRGGGG